MIAVNDPAVGPRPKAVSPSWRSVFLTGLALWIASVAVTAVTQNSNMIPTVVMLGSFLVPASAVVWYLDHDRSPVLTPALVLRAFIVGGVPGVLAVSLLESWLLGSGVLAYVGAGLIEELAKLLALAFIARGLTRYAVRDGIVLGAAVGFGFAALESSGYALNALIVQQGSQIGFSLSSLVLTELLRGVLAPVGHGLWTGILGGVLFGASRRGRLRPSLSVVATYLLMAVLHGLWDSMQDIAVLVTEVLTATPLQRLTLAMLASGRLTTPTSQQLVIDVLAQIVGLALVSSIGIAVLWRVWRTRSMDGAQRSAAAGEASLVT